MGGKKGSQDYEVGFSKPPSEHRFRKGQSGNPSGSRKKRRRNDPGEWRDVLYEEVQREISVTFNGATEQTTFERAIIRSILAAAARGLPQAMRLAQGLLEEARKSKNAADIPSQAEMAKMSTAEVAEAYEKLMRAGQ